MGKVLMNNLIKILITLIVVLNTSSLLSQTTIKKVSTGDTLTVNIAMDSLAISTTTQDKPVKRQQFDFLVVGDKIIDTTPYQSIMFHQDSIRKNLNRPYNKDVFNFKYDSFKEKMKDPWIGNILKEIFFR